MQKHLATLSGGFLLYMISKEERIINKFGNQMLLSEEVISVATVVEVYFQSLLDTYLYNNPCVAGAEKVKWLGNCTCMDWLGMPLLKRQFLCYIARSVTSLTMSDNYNVKHGFEVCTN